jgi:gamma-glutamylcyclotransferase (GGCT)/AIG2-like uncharacterized protein YtfP
MTLHFAYGSNMSRTMMTARCPTARALGTATLQGWRFVITADGYASIVPLADASVHGVLWRLGARDLAAVNAYESVESGLYRRRTLPVLCEAGRRAALVYVARSRNAGRPRPGYLDMIVAAARDWELPESYIRSLERWATSQWRGVRAVETGELR